MNYEPVIGLEVHAQLKTATKIFCGCSTAFGSKPNTQTCPVCMGLPGALPVLNEAAARFAVRMIMATGGELNLVSLFARKNYFYPDLPKGYQVSQFARPVGKGGAIPYRLGDEQRQLRLFRIHLEEDAGKSIHAQGQSLVDINRCGVPLIEIVSQPELSTPAEASACLVSLRQLLRYLGICDGNMEEGSLRCDANVSVRPVGQKELGTKTEVKNMNSFKAVERALRFEIDRQINLVSQGGVVEQQTMLWDENAGKAQPMRGKEESLDYRYFPEPDLVPLRIESDWLLSLTREMPELPEAKRQRFVSEHGLPSYDAGVLTSDRCLADYFESVVAISESPKAASNWIMGEVLRFLAEQNMDISAYRVPPSDLGSLIREIEAGAVSGSAAKDVLLHMATQGGKPRAVIEQLGLAQVSDRDVLRAAVGEVIANEATQVQQYRQGKLKVLGYLVGNVMQATGGKANPKTVNELLKEHLAE
jgi:aspartyl-tRNA(Asn)/glutamyl-tRNA(Gln) amidotransferase subunit B